MATPLAAVFNSSPDTVELLRVVLQQAGFVVASAFTFQLRDGLVDLTTFMRQHQPDVVIYDVAVPYDANWALFERLRRNPAMSECQIVVTSTNAQYVQQLAGRDQRIYEIVGKPLDLGEIVRATKEALRSRPTS
jgi:DNA-binding response OmpR family regulator